MTALSIDARKMVEFKRNQWAKESAMHFCRLARIGATFTNVIYPTGLKTVVASINSEKAEIELRHAKELRAAGYKVVAV